MSKSSSDLVSAVDDLMDSPGGLLLKQSRDFLRLKMKSILFVFIFGIIIGFPITKQLIAWLIEPSRLPDGVEIIVTSPLEFIMLQLRIAMSIGLFFVITTLIYFGIYEGLKSPTLKQKLAGLNYSIPKTTPTILFTTIAILLLSISGLYYSWELLTPMLLEYLTTDAQNAGLSTDWRLDGYVGFITNLSIASIIGFQAPVATLLVLRFGVIDRSQIKQYRRHIWFSAFVIGALFSPPDPLSLFLVAVPVILLFEISLVIDTIIRKQ
jgi:sec-independent protein translocase protein TatC